MAITNFTADVENISKLQNDPIDGDDIKTAADLKARFDKAGADIKTWITGVLTPYVNGLTDGTNLGSGAVKAANLDTGAVTTAKIDDGAVTAKKIADSAVSGKHLQNAIFHATVTAASWSVTSPGRHTLYAASGSLAGGGLSAPWLPDSGYAFVIPTATVANQALAGDKAYWAAVTISKSGTWGTGGYSYMVNWGISTGGSAPEDGISFELFIIP